MMTDESSRELSGAVNQSPSPVLGAGAREREAWWEEQYRIQAARIEELEAALADTVTETGGRGEGTWQPIETKPKDHFPVLVWGPFGHRVAFEDVTWTWFEAGAEEPMDDWKPSHWMPLPRRPSVSSTERWTDDELAAAKAEAKKLHDYFHPQDGGGK